MTPTNRRPGEPALSVEAAPAYEFLMTLSAFSEADHRDVAEVGPQWFADVEQHAGPALLGRLADLNRGNGDQFIQLIPLAYDAPAPRGVAALLGHLEQTDAEQLALRLTGYYDYHFRRTVSPEVMRAAVGGDAAAAREFLAATSEWGDWNGFLERAIELGPPDLKRELLELLAAWYERVWRELEPAVLPILERDVEAKRLLSTELPFERFVEVATNGVEFVPQPGVERLVLIPTYANRPWVSSAEHRGALIMIYPVADESLSADRDAPPLRLVRLSKALGDEKRLRILRALAERPRSLMEMAEHFGLPKTTMHHHMVTLRSAGLVTVASGTKRYRLRHDALPDIGQLLSGYIGAGPEPAGAGTRQDRMPPSGRAPARPGRRMPPARVGG